ncbi:hypothetical protein DPMN_052234 [Dreissena polymorpha]|uniref:Uncharacterized protein n=1 Tax=Dreissena polymorpha TaxID=45954 RepID=A0A9D4HMV1_DREPO|nr:hypothetical protein DPMN_052234 [Dreissena polymorpha]
MERKEREREEKRQCRESHGKSSVPQIRIGYEQPEDPYSSGSKLSKNSGSSRSDDDNEVLADAFDRPSVCLCV